MNATTPPATTTPYLSKTDYLHGLQCPKLLWHMWNARHLIPAPDQQTLAIFNEGKKVGQLAWQLFPGGTEIRGGTFDEAVGLSEQAVQQRHPLYEAAFVSNGCGVRVDILVPADGDSWDLVEIKSTTGVEEIHLHDLTLQAYVLTGAGLKIRRCVLAHINSSFVRHGPIDPHQFFVLEDVTNQVSILSQGIEAKLEEMFRLVGMPLAPAIPIGRQCDDPPCPLHHVCWGHLRDGNVTELRLGREKPFRLMAGGVTKIADIPDDVELTRCQKIQRHVARTGKLYVDKPAIRAFLKRLKFPISFIDFESFALPIPVYDGTGPYWQIVFQFSMHVLRSLGAKPEHFSFLAEGTDDPRSEFMRRLYEVLPPEGSVIAFNSAFELARLKECADPMPEFQPWVDGIKHRMEDLLVPFRRFHAYHPTQRGSCSIKHVLPAITGKNYDDLAIQNGTTASLQFLRATFGNLSEAERTRIRNELHKYCHLDTFGLVAITEELRRLVSGQVVELK